ncbi:MAG: hypothetical protein ACHQT9_03345 [Candidatus Saccharimonadales bacterium]
MRVPPRPPEYDYDDLDATTPPDQVAIRAAWAATIAEPERLQAESLQAYIDEHGRTPDSVVRSAEGYQQFSFGTDEKGLFLKRVARECLVNTTGPISPEVFGA